MCLVGHLQMTPGCARFVLAVFWSRAHEKLYPSHRQGRRMITRRMRIPVDEAIEVPGTSPGWRQPKRFKASGKVGAAIVLLQLPTLPDGEDAGPS